MLWLWPSAALSNSAHDFWKPGGVLCLCDRIPHSRDSTTMVLAFLQVRTLRSDSMPVPLQDVARKDRVGTILSILNIRWTGDGLINDWSRQRSETYRKMISTSKDNCVLNVGVFASEQPGLGESDSNIVQEFYSLPVIHWQTDCK